MSDETRYFLTGLGYGLCLFDPDEEDVQDARQSIQDQGGTFKEVDLATFENVGFSTPETFPFARFTSFQTEEETNGIRANRNAN